jgi:hypothetical protein
MTSFFDVYFPKLKRIDSLAEVRSKPISINTCEGAGTADWQALPEDTQIFGIAAITAFASAPLINKLTVLSTQLLDPLIRVSATSIST